MEWPTDREAEDTARYVFQNAIRRTDVEDGDHVLFAFMDVAPKIIAAKRVKPKGYSCEVGDDDRSYSAIDNTPMGGWTLFTRSGDYLGGWATHYAVIPRENLKRMPEKKPLSRIVIDHFPVVEIFSDYDCTGKWFSDTPRIKRTPTAVVVTQGWGQDV
jgi:hypothetical protein